LDDSKSKNIINEFAEALKDSMPAERAAVILSLVAGFQSMRRVIGLSALSDTKPARLRKILTPIFGVRLENELNL
jgi:hypothetical protein